MALQWVEQLKHSLHSPPPAGVPEQHLEEGYMIIASVWEASGMDWKLPFKLPNAIVSKAMSDPVDVRTYMAVKVCSCCFLLLSS